MRTFKLFLIGLLLIPFRFKRMHYVFKHTLKHFLWLYDNREKGEVWCTLCSERLVPPPEKYMFHFFRKAAKIVHYHPIDYVAEKQNNKE